MYRFDLLTQKIYCLITRYNLDRVNVIKFHTFTSFVDVNWLLFCIFLTKYSARKWNCNSLSIPINVYKLSYKISVIEFINTAKNNNDIFITLKLFFSNICFAAIKSKNAVISEIAFVWKLNWKLGYHKLFMFCKQDICSFWKEACSCSKFLAIWSIVFQIIVFLDEKR